MAAVPPSRPLAVDINVTPMIDVLLVLLVTFFLLNLPLPHTNVQVPEPPGGRPVRATPQLVLQLPDVGGFLLNGQPVPEAELDEVLRVAYEHRPAKLLFIGAGGTRRYDDVIQAIDRAKGAGVQVVAFLP